MDASDFDFPYLLSRHAVEQMRKRGIPAAWVHRVIEHPDDEEIDSEDPSCRHAIKRSRDFGDRILRVIYNITTEPLTVVTAFFDE